MGKKTLIEEMKITKTIKNIPKHELTVLDFIEAFKELYPTDWSILFDRYGLYGEKRRYTASTYLSNRLDVYSQKLDSLLFRFTRYSEDKFRDRRRATEEEKKVFGSPWIAVYKKKALK